MREDSAPLKKTVWTHQMLEDLKGKRALITGSSTGIGAALAIDFGRLGVAVAVHGNSNADAARAIADQITNAGGKAIVVLGDVTKPETGERLVGDTVAAFGGLDILVNNAGALLDRAPNAEFDNSLYDRVMDLNVRSVLNVTKAAYPHLKASGSGAIVNTGSIAGRVGGSGGAGLYAAAKSAVHSLSRNMAREFGPDGVRVNTVAPGVIVTPFHEKTPQAVLDAAKAATALNRLGEAKECVGAYVFLASQTMSGYITGQIIDVNGGQLMP
jgi:3-oxoacyl-[acyl-carrier protein] reductase